jgi:hypothetical protein
MEIWYTWRKRTEEEKKRGKEGEEETSGKADGMR